MTNKITLGLVGVVLIISVYNSVKISNIKVENVIEQPNRSNTLNNNVVPQQNNLPTNPNMENLNAQPLNSAGKYSSSAKRKSDESCFKWTNYFYQI